MKMMYGSNSSTACAYGDARKNRQAISLGIALLLSLFLAVVAGAQDSTGRISVLTYHYDNFRTGQDTHETTLTLSNVNTTQFGRLFMKQVSGNIVGQPLYVPGLTINSVTHDVVFVATKDGIVYAFDANDGSSVWQTNLIASGEKAAGHGQGVTSTPVIDASTKIMYVEAKSQIVNSTTGAITYLHRLHALDILSGKKAFGPALITGTFAGINFDDTIINQMNRPGLLLANGIVYIAFASDCGDFGPSGICGTPPVNYYGWVFAYNAANLQLEGIFNATPTPSDEPGQNGGGIWMSGAGLAADNSTPTANVFFSTGNGATDPTATSPTNFGDSILKLGLTSTTAGAIAPDQDLKLVDWFTPFNEETLETRDLDLGSGGVLLIPDRTSAPQHLLVQAGKGSSADQAGTCSPRVAPSSTIYVLNRDQLTGNNQHFCASCNLQAGNTNIQQEIRNAVGGMWAMPAFWNNTVYFWGSGDTLRGFALGSNGLLSASPTVTSDDCYPQAANVSISANGTSNGIVWAAETGSTQPMILNAYDARSGDRLYSSATNQGRDNAGGDVHFIVPVVANGKVYLGGTQLSVYGLNPPDFTISIAPATISIAPGDFFSFPVTITPINGFKGDVGLLARCPGSVICSIGSVTITAGSASSALNVITTTSTLPGNYSITVTGIGGDITQSQTVTLSVL